MKLYCTDPKLLLVPAVVKSIFSSDPCSTVGQVPGWVAPWNGTLDATTRPSLVAPRPAVDADALTTRTFAISSGSVASLPHAAAKTSGTSRAALNARLTRCGMVQPPSPSQ